MPLEQIQIDRLLAGLSSAVRQAVGDRLSLLTDIESLSAVIAAAIQDVDLAEILRAAMNEDESGREAFDVLWSKISRQLRSTIRVWIRCKTPEHIEIVEADTMLSLWTHRHKYDPAKGFVLTWARAFAKKQALWYKCRVPGAGQPPDLATEGVFELPPSACFAELLEMIQDRQPCEAVAFLLNKYLDWEPARIAATYGNTPLTAVVADIQAEMVSRYPILRSVRAKLTPLAGRTLHCGGRTLSDCAANGDLLIASITRWSGEVKRSLGNRVISQAKELLRLACELRVGAHELLALIWCRFLNRTSDDLCARARMLLLALLDVFCADYKTTDLKSDDLAWCTSPLRETMEKSPRRTLEDCSNEDLCADIAAWRDRVQTMLLGPARDRNLLAFSYLCGCLPGINGPARGGV